MLKTANKISIAPRKNSNVDPFSNDHTNILDESPIKAGKIDLKKASR